jgi:hypothetical protein
VRASVDLAIDVAAVAAIWIAMAERAPMFLATVYAPGYVGGLILCALHGHYEHASGTTSHYGRAYNVLLFNDGYHVEHHRFPSAHWSDLPKHRDGTARTSAWPAPLRWIETGGLERLESMVLRSPGLQRFVLGAHERAFRRLLKSDPGVRPPGQTSASDLSIGIVGGGLFPRTAIVLRRLIPDARLTIVDANRQNLDIAGRFLPGDVECRHEMFDGRAVSFDMLVLPLSFRGSRAAIYARPPAPLVFVHDWLWRKRGTSAIVSLALLKRVNLVRRPGRPGRPGLS